MYRKIIGILVCMLMIGSGFFPIVSADQVDQSYTNHSQRDGQYGEVTATEGYLTQTFFPTLPLLTKVELYLSRTSGASGRTFAFGIAQDGVGTLVEQTYSTNIISTGGGWKTFDFGDVSITPGTTCWIYFGPMDDQDLPNDEKIYWHFGPDSNPPPGFAGLGSGDWRDGSPSGSSNMAYDHTFKTYGETNTPPGNPSNLDAHNPTQNSIDLSWTEGSDSDKTKIMRKTGSYPSSPTDSSATQAYFSTGASTTDTGLSPGTNYYYRAWAYNSDTGLYSTGYSQDTATTIPPRTITFNTEPSNGGTITFDGSSYNNGDSTSKSDGTYSIFANPASGDWEFDHWTTTGGISIDGSTATVSGDGTIKAWFEEPLYTVNFQTDPTNQGSIVFEDIKYNNGDSKLVSSGNYIVTAPASEGYIFDHWSSSGGISIDDSTSWRATATVSNSGTIKAWFKQPSQADWTIMLYLDGDNDLEGPGIEDFLEMNNVDSTEDVHMLVQFDRTPGEDARYDDWKSTKRYRIRKDMDPTNNNAISDIGEANMANQQTIIDFVNWGRNHYPANNYCLILWDHGSGWQDYSSFIDETSGDDTLSLDEMRNALSAITNNGNNPIDLLGFDACLMQMIEVGYELRNFADYMTASEQTCPHAGFNYDDTLSYLIGSPETSAERLGQQFVSDYIDENGRTMSTVDLNNIANLADDVDNFATVLQDDNFLLDIFLAIMDVESYEDLDYVDLQDFAELIQFYIDDDTVDNAAQAVIDEIGNTVLYENHDPLYLYSHGISIYCPFLLYNNEYEDIAFSDDTEWDEFIDWQYKNKENHPPDKPDAPSPSDGATNIGYSVALSCSVTDIDQQSMSVSFYDASDDSKIGTDNDVPSGERATVQWSGLSGSTTYSWYAVADDGENTTQSDTWEFTTKEPGANLKCSGDLIWDNKVYPDSTVDGIITVENIGDTGSELDWTIIEYPDWGSWTFNPSGGEDLTPEDGLKKIDVTVEVPNEKCKTFTGEVKIVNTHDTADECTLSVSIKTKGCGRQKSILFHSFPDWLMQRFPLLARLLQIPSFNRLLNL